MSLLDTSDQDFIDKELEITNNKTMHYPKFQFSKFVGQDQFVIRADTWDDFLEAKKKLNTIIEKVEKKEPSLKSKCADCGADMVYKTGVGAKGKWEAMFCPNADREDKTKHKPIWL